MCDLGEFFDVVLLFRGVFYDVNILLFLGNDWWFFWCNILKCLFDAYSSGFARRDRSSVVV